MKTSHVKFCFTFGRDAGGLPELMSTFSSKWSASVYRSMNRQSCVTPESSLKQTPVKEALK